MTFFPPTTRAHAAGRQRFMTNIAKPPAKPRRSESNRLECPHCAWPAVIRSSTKMSTLTREATYWCTNVECGHTFTALTEIVRTLSPSATPNPSVSLPLSSHVRRTVLRDVLEHAPSSEYEARQTSPVTLDLFQRSG